MPNSIYIKSLDDTQAADYTAFLKSSSQNLLYASYNYKKLIEHHLACTSNYLLAFDEENKIRGALPIMIKKNSQYGHIANSLPYYGSNGGIIVDETLSIDKKNAIRNALIKQVDEFIEAEECVASTLVTSPFDSETREWLETHYPYDFQDSRVGQITPLPSIQEGFEELLMKSFQNPRPRNIRKAIKSDIQIHFSHHKEDIDFLFDVHKDNIESIGGLAKKKDFFESILDICDEQDFRIYIATKDGVRIAGLLLFYFNKTVEYFTPATVSEFRNLQPSSLLIFEAMKDAIQNNYQYWNWGGTWQSQTGVYDFKKKWGAMDYPYYYYTRIFDKKILNLNKNTLLNEYPNFFVVPFDKL